MLRRTLGLVVALMGCGGEAPPEGNRPQGSEDAGDVGSPANDLPDARTDDGAPGAPDVPPDAAVAADADAQVSDATALDAPVEAAPGVDAGEDSLDGPMEPDAEADAQADVVPEPPPDATEPMDVTASIDAAEAVDAAEIGDDRSDSTLDALDAFDAPPTCAPGETRPCYGGPAGTVGVGSCAAGVERCGEAGWTGVCEGERRPAAERCDGVDNNCDGALDDGLPTQACGIGACARSVPTCLDGRPVTLPCVPGTPGVEVCDGVDNDCDRMVDESMPAVTCGVGRCQTGTLACLGGGPAPCVPLPPSPEACDGADNDCDGMTDEGMPDGAPCYTWLLGGAPGVGRCLPGYLACRGASLNLCVHSTAGMPMSEVCNGRDDDCDGLVDELTAALSPCTRTERGCTTRGLTRCRADGTQYCDAPTPTASPEVCNGRDDDCDNLVDENPTTLAPTPCTVGFGQCARTGMYRCTGPTANQCDATPGTPAVEVCDGIDNNCDNLPDDLGPQPATCTIEHPWCRRRGNWFCTPIGRVCAGGVPGNGFHFDYAEVCNGRDDDCNGLVDEFGTQLADGTWAPCPRGP